LAALGEFGAAALAYAKALEIMPNSRNAQAGMQQLQQNPAASAAASQALQQASERIARDQAQAAVGQANALVAQYNDLVSRTLPDLQRQQQELERTVSAYMGRDAAGRAATHRSVYDACDRVIGRHDAFIMTLQGLQGRAAAVPQLAAEIDS